MSDTTSQPSVSRTESAIEPAAPTGDGKAVAPSAEAAASAPAAPGNAQRRKAGFARKSLRLIRLTLLALLLLLLAFRILLQFMLPAAVRRTARAYGLEARYDRHEINLTGGHVGLWHLVLTPAEGGAPLASVDYCRGDVSPWDLLFRRLTVRHLEAESMDMTLERDEHGEIPLLKRFAAKAAASPTATAAKSGDVNAGPSTKPADINLTSPFELDLFRIGGLRLHLIDRSVSPALDTTVLLNVRLMDLRSPDRPTRFDLALSARPVVDLMLISGQGHAAGKVLDAGINVVVTGLHPEAAAAYLAPLGIKPAASDLGMTFRGKLTTGGSARPGALSASARLDGIAMRADGKPVAGLDKITLDATAVSPTFADIARLVVEGGTASAERTASGALRVAGVELGPRTRKPRPKTHFTLNLAALELKDIKAAFTDHAVTPAAAIGVELDELMVKNLTNDPQALEGGGGPPIELSASMRAPGVARSIKLEGSARSAESQTADLTLRIDGVKPVALKPYLDTAGIDCLLNDGSITCGVRASVKPSGAIDARLTHLKYTDGQTELLGFDDVNVGGLALASDGTVHVETIDLAGPALSFRRLANGTLESLGFRTRTASAASPAAAPSPAGTNDVPDAKGATTQPTTAAAPAALPKIEIGRLTWKGVRVKYEDQFVSPKSVVTLDDAGVEIESLRLDGAATTQPAKLRAWVKAPGLAGNLGVEGTIAPGPQASVAEFDLTGDGLTAEPIRAYLLAAGVEPVLRDGSLRAHLKAELKPAPDGSGMLLSAVSVSGVQLKQGGGEELAGLDTLNVTGLDVRPSATAVQSIDLQHPRAHVTREKDGTFTVAGIHTLPPTTAPAPAGSPLTLGTASAATTAAGKSVAATRPATQRAAATQAVARLSSLKLKDAELWWTDRAAGTASPVDLKATVTGEVRGLALGDPAAPPANVDLLLRADGVVDQLRVNGTVSPSPDAPAAKLTVDGRGIRAGAVAAYLPPTIIPTLRDGRVKLALDAAVSPNPGGGQRAHVLVSGLDYRDGADGPPLLGFDSAAIRVSRYDAAAKIVALDELSLTGLETAVRTSPQGMALLGIQLKPAAATQPAAAASATQPTTKPAAGAIAIREPATSATSQPATAADVARAVAATRLELPLVSIEKLQLGVRRVTVTDEARPAAAPLVVSDLELKNRARIEMLGPDSEDRPPADLELVCHPAPLADSLTLRAKIAPFAQRPSAAIEVAATGIRGGQLLGLFPELAGRVDGSELTDGSIKLQAKGEMKIDRRDLLRLDFTRPFDLDLSITDAEYRATPDGPVLAGLKEFRTEGMHVEPATGAARAKLVELNNFSARAARQKDGIHALGLVLLKGPTTSPATTQPAAPEPSESAKQKMASGPTTRPAGEIRIDSLVVSGTDLLMEDQAVDPPLLVPITSLDLEVRDLSNYLMYDADKSMRFSLLVNSGKVPLPRSGKKSRPQNGDAVLASATATTSATAAAAPATGPTTAPTTSAVDFDQRELFSQITASGKLSLYPGPRGWVKIALSGLEVAALKGEARAVGFDTSAGTFDADLDARFLDSGALDLRPKFVFVDLGIKDSEQGSIAKALGLPVSLDGAITMLQDASGQISLPLHVKVEEGKVNTGSVVASACGAVAAVVATAVASAPLKVGEGVASLVGIKFGKHKPPPDPLDLDFDAGSPVPAAFVMSPDADASGGAGAGGAVALIPASVLERLRKDKALQVTVRHEMGAGDVKRIGNLTNPPEDDAWSLAYRLRLTRNQLLKQRARVAGQARGELGSGIDATATLAQLRGLDRELATTEDGLDALNELTRPGASRQAVRRTRAACLALARDRLIAVRDALLAAGIPDAAARVNVTQPTFDPNDDLDGGRVNLTFKIAKQRQ